MLMKYYNKLVINFNNNLLDITTESKRFGRMVEEDHSGPKGPGFELCNSLKLFSVYLMDVMINASMTCLILNRLQI